MSSEILHGLFNGKIIPWERRNSDNEVQRELLRRIENEERYFIGKMSLDDCARFQELSRLQMELGAAEEARSSAYSFALGMLLMLDVIREGEAM